MDSSQTASLLTFPVFIVFPTFPSLSHLTYLFFLKFSNSCSVFLFFYLYGWVCLVVVGFYFVFNHCCQSEVAKKRMTQQVSATKRALVTAADNNLNIILPLCCQPQNKFTYRLSNWVAKLCIRVTLSLAEKPCPTATWIHTPKFCTENLSVTYC